MKLCPYLWQGKGHLKICRKGFFPLSHQCIFLNLGAVPSAGTERRKHSVTHFDLRDDRKNVIFQKTAEDNVETMPQVLHTG